MTTVDTGVDLDVQSTNSTSHRLCTMVRAANQRSNGFYFTVAASFVAALLFIYYDLGVLAFVLVVFVAIFGFGFRDKFSNEETASAYSVFNKDGRSIVGGFTASQFERQMRGPLWSGNESDNPLKGPIADHGLKNSSIGREKVPENERIRRRMAAAEAAQRRLHAKEND